MSDIRNGYSESQEREKSENHAMYGFAIHAFLSERYAAGTDRLNTVRYGADFDIDGGNKGEIDIIRSGGDFTISNIRTTPRTADPAPGDRVDLHFYVGKTEFHVCRAAADRVYELMGDTNTDEEIK